MGYVLRNCFGPRICLFYQLPEFKLVFCKSALRVSAPGLTDVLCIPLVGHVSRAAVSGHEISADEVLEMRLMLRLPIRNHSCDFVYLLQRPLLGIGWLPRLAAARGGHQHCWLRFVCFWFRGIGADGGHKPRRLDMGGRDGQLLTGSVGHPGIYGTLGVSAAVNMPGGRYYPSQWTDSSGNLWLFGGGGYDVNDTYGSLNDLWEFNWSTDQSAW